MRAREPECELDRNASIHVSASLVEHNASVTGTVSVCSSMSVSMSVNVSVIVSMSSA